MHVKPESRALTRLVISVMYAMRRVDRLGVGCMIRAGSGEGDMQKLKRRRGARICKVVPLLLLALSMFGTSSTALADPDVPGPEDSDQSPATVDLTAPVIPATPVPVSPVGAVPAGT